MSWTDEYTLLKETNNSPPYPIMASGTACLKKEQPFTYHIGSKTTGTAETCGFEGVGVLGSVILLATLATVWQIKSKFSNWLSPYWGFISQWQLGEWAVLVQLLFWLFLNFSLFADLPLAWLTVDVVPLSHTRFTWLGQVPQPQQWWQMMGNLSQMSYTSHLGGTGTSRTE